MTKIIPLAIENLVTLKAGAKHELLLNKPASGRLVGRQVGGRVHGLTGRLTVGRTDMQAG